MGRDGYGLAPSKPLGKNMMTAHRVAYLLAHPGESEPPMVLHTCDNPLCCNSLHLYAGDQAINMADMKAKGRALGGRLEGEPWLKVNDELALVIAEERLVGASVRVLAAKYGMSAPGIRSVIKRAAEGRKVRLRSQPKRESTQ
jgi:hypothetical protein